MPATITVAKPAGHGSFVKLGHSRQGYSAPFGPPNIGLVHLGGSFPKRTTSRCDRPPTPPPAFKMGLPLPTFNSPDSLTFPRTRVVFALHSPPRRIVFYFYGRMG
ncbi:hypothetical protein AVEN_228979-1 [Araneus ventricosus]|uniref:Uncharacterized protein n=1 Tax=Araneus ventricosus TaxID=182803 RepID=A0A4Y2I6R4_ARAVE|nr:hypothetical protein AVEN_228979-1 [Araneus ventricosus]